MIVQLSLRGSFLSGAKRNGRDGWEGISKIHCKVLQYSFATTFKYNTYQVKLHMRASSSFEAQSALSILVALN